MTGPAAFAPAEAVLAEEEALEPAEPEHPESASAPQRTSRVEAVMTRRERFTDSSLRGCGFVKPGCGAGCFDQGEALRRETRGGSKSKPQERGYAASGRKRL